MDEPTEARELWELALGHKVSDTHSEGCAAHGNGASQGDSGHCCEPLVCCSAVMPQGPLGLLLL